MVFCGIVLRSWGGPIHCRSTRHGVSKVEENRTVPSLRAW